MSLLDTASLVVTPNGYKAGTLYSVIPSDGSGDMTVTRATTATRVNSAGLIESVANNVPRLDYSNGTCPSILVEPQRTNLSLYSEQFNNAYWNKNQVSILANDIASPDGATTADKLVEDSTNDLHYINIPQSTVSSGTNTISVYAKADGRNWIWLYLFDGVLGSLLAYFNVSNGTIGTVASGLTANIESVGSGWYRCSITRTQANAGNGGFGLASADNTISYLGNGTSGAYIWGAQLEVGSYATSYIPTTSASVTRNADVISKTGISSLIGQTEGTIYFNISKIGNTDSEMYISDGTYDNAIKFQYYDSGNIIFAVVLVGGVAQCVLSSSSFTVSDFLKIAIKYKNNSFALWINGTEVSTDISGSTFAPSTLNRINFGQPDNNATGVLKANIKTVALWQTALNNTQLAQLTTI